jgi:hypothetical protein
MARKVKKSKKTVKAKKVTKRAYAKKTKAKKTGKTKVAGSKRKLEAEGVVVDIDTAAYTMGYLIP